jgi:hypothetical protein
MLGASGGDNVWQTGNCGKSDRETSEWSQTDMTSERYMTPSSPEFATSTSLGMAADTASYRNR